MTESSQRLTTVNLVWLSMLAAVPVYALVTLWVEPTADPGLDQLTLMVFPLIALVETGIALVVPRFLKGNYLTTCLVRWALVESIAILGMGAFFVGGSAWLAYGLMGWSFVLMALLGPSRAALERSG